MRRSRVMLGIVGLVTIGGVTACGAVSEAQAANRDQVQAVSRDNLVAASVEVSPNRANPGQTITVRATCNDNSTTATISSPAFGSVIAARPPGATSALLIAAVNLSPTLQPSTFTVTAMCNNGATATTKLIVVTPASVQPTMGPHTGGGALAGAVNDAGSATPWLIGSAATLMLAGLAGLVSRRRRRTPGQARPTDPPADALVHAGAPVKGDPDQAHLAEPAAQSNDQGRRHAADQR